MRLEGTDDALVVHQADRLQQRVQLVGMVGIIVIDVRAAVAALILEPAARAMEAGERGLRILAGNAEFPRHRAGGQRVQRVVAADDAEADLRIRLAAADDVKLAEILREVLAVHGVRRVEAERQIRQTLQRVAGVLVIAVGDDQPVLRHERGERAERMLHIGKILEKVQMVGVDIEDDRDRREEVQEGVAVFAALEDDGIALADAVARAEQRQKAADHDRRVQPGLHENMREHGGRRRLAVGTGDADGVLVRLHDVAPGLGTLKDGNASGAGSGDLGVVVVRGSRADEAVGALDILGAVADRDLDALGDQLVRGDGGVHVRAGDLHPHAPQHQPQRAHRHAADADQMAVLPGLQILLDMLTGRIFHVWFLQKI